MTTATLQRRPGWVTFAAVVMFAVGFSRIISAINLYRGGDQVADLTNSMFGNDLWVWATWDLCLAVLALVAGWSLLRGSRFGFVLAYIWAIWLMVHSFLIMVWAPWFAVAALTLSTLVVFGLASTSGWSKEELA